MTTIIRRVKDLARRDYLRRLAAIKQEPKQSQCRAWIAIVNNRWHWSSPSNLQLPNPFRN
jgi:hypothetical protein